MTTIDQTADPGEEEQMQVLTLRSGVEMPKPLVLVVVNSLRRLAADHPLDFYEVVEIAKNPAHNVWGTSGEHLESLHLLENGRMPNSVRDIVLAATDGEGLSLRLVNPVATSAD